MNHPLDLHTAPPAVNWSRLVRERLATFPANGWTARQDAALYEAIMTGRPVTGVKGLPDRPGAVTGRALAMMDLIRDAYGRPTLDGRQALAEALRERCDA